MKIKKLSIPVKLHAIVYQKLMNSYEQLLQRTSVARNKLYVFVSKGVLDKKIFFYYCFYLFFYFYIFLEFKNIYILRIKPCYIKLKGSDRFEIGALTRAKTSVTNSSIIFTHATDIYIRESEMEDDDWQF